MPIQNLRAGILAFKIDGVVHLAKGAFSYSLGGYKRETILGSSEGIHGYKMTPIVAHITGSITDDPELDLMGLTTLDGVTVTLDLFNGKTIILRNAWYAGDATVNSDEGNIDVKFEARSGEEMSR